MNDLVEDLHSFKREAADERHRGKGLSVTKALRRAGLVKFFVSPARLAVLADEGKQVHMVCEDIARGDDTNYWREIPWIEPYGYAFQQFRRDFQFKAELIERRIEHPTGYFGFLDMAGQIYTHSKKRTRKAVIELKRAVPAKPYALQVAAYHEALAHEIPAFKSAERICVYLRADGTYKAEKHEDPLDIQKFFGALTVARLREKWGLISQDDERRFDDLLRGQTPEFEEAVL